jgi:hypothetical protein
MRLLLVPLVLFAAHSAKVCDSEDKAKVDATASADVGASSAAAADAKVVVALPRIGGSVASAGKFSVELALHENGLVEGLVSDAAGRLVSDGIKLSAAVRAKGGASENVQLAFSAPRGRFEGRAKAGVELAPGPVDATLEVAGKSHGCKLSVAALLPEPRLGGSMLAAGAYSAELFAKSDGEIDAFVKDSAGAAVNADAGAAFKVVASAKGGAREEIGLHFDAARACFTGKAKAGVELAPGPLELVVDAKVGAGVGRLESVALQVEAAHGGQVVAVGDFSVELVAKGKQLSAFVFDASGKAHAAGDLDLKLDVGAGAGSALALKWDAPSASYVGTVAANIDLSLQPLRVSLIAAGRAFAGAVASLDAAAKIRGKAAAKLDTTAKLDASAKLGGDTKLAAGAKAKLDESAKASVSKGASASLKVTPPKVDVKQSAGAGASAKAGGGAKASGGISIGLK